MPKAQTYVLPRVAVFGAMLSAAGLPLYIHLPLFATQELGISLATLGAVLLGIRVMDFAQDPLLGRIGDRVRQYRPSAAAGGVSALALGFWMLFAAPDAVASLPWLVLSLVIVFTAYSFCYILFYAQGVGLASKLGRDGHVRLAGWREGGLLAGVCLATATPATLQWMGRSDTAYRDFALGFVVLALIAAMVMHRLWRTEATSARTQTQGFGALLGSGEIRQLLGLGLVNALPVAITSTLFLFFVGDRLVMPEYAGAFLLLFFVSAGVSVPLWTAIASRIGARRTLMSGMVLSIVAFLGAAFLDAGAGRAFALICIGSGAALAADMVMLPAFFAQTLARTGQAPATAFGLWNFVNKMALAVAAAAVLPMLQWVDYMPGQANAPETLMYLGLAYAALPCLLKIAAFGLVLRLPEQAKL